MTNVFPYSLTISAEASCQHEGELLAGIGVGVQQAASAGGVGQVQGAGDVNQVFQGEAVMDGA